MGKVEKINYKNQISYTVLSKHLFLIGVICIVGAHRIASTPASISGHVQ